MQVRYIKSLLFLLLISVSNVFSGFVSYAILTHSLDPEKKIMLVGDYHFETEEAFENIWKATIGNQLEDFDPSLYKDFEFIIEGKEPFLVKETHAIASTLDKFYKMAEKNKDIPIKFYEPRGLESDLLHDLIRGIGIDPQRIQRNLPTAIPDYGSITVKNYLSLLSRRCQEMQDWSCSNGATEREKAFFESRKEEFKQYVDKATESFSSIDNSLYLANIFFRLFKDENTNQEAAELFLENLDFLYADAAFTRRILESQKTKDITIFVGGDGHTVKLIGYLQSCGYRLSENERLVGEHAFGATTIKADLLTRFSKSFFRSYYKTVCIVDPFQIKGLDVNTCSNPTCSNAGVNRCARCKEAKYCSRDCQREHWREHKKECVSKK